MKKQTIIKIFLILAGLLALSLFVIPLFFGAYINIGTVTGIICSCMLLLYGLFFKKINQGIVFLYSKKVGRICCRILLILVAILVITVITETVFMIRGAGKCPDGTETVVVLGCRVYGDKPSLSMIERLDAAYEYLTDHPDTKCVLSGGMGEGENISEARCMYDYLVSKGISKERLFQEAESKDTFENLANTKRFLEEHGLNPDIAIVTSEYHAYRSSLIASQLGIKSTSIPAKTAWWLLPTYYVRELYGILHQWIFGR